MAKDSHPHAQKFLSERALSRLARTTPEHEEVSTVDPMERIDDVAREFGCSTRFLKDEAKKGRLKLIRLSYHMWRVRRSEKLRYLAGRQIGEVAA